MPAPYRIGLLHGAGYAGGELIHLLTTHSDATLTVVTSRSSASKPVWAVHPQLRGQSDLVFSDPDEVVLDVDDRRLTGTTGDGDMVDAEIPGILNG